MDPYTSTREQFTSALLDQPIPSNAAEDWQKYAQNTKDLLRKLAYHEAMRPNLQQTYMTPASSKNKVYFMWDYVGRTLASIYGIDPAETSETAQNKKAWEDITSRSATAAGLILDEQPGMLDMMVSSTNPGQSGPSPQFDAETLEIARKLKA